MSSTGEMAFALILGASSAMVMVTSAVSAIRVSPFLGPQETARHHAREVQLTEFFDFFEVALKLGTHQLKLVISERKAVIRASIMACSVALGMLILFASQRIDRCARSGYDRELLPLLLDGPLSGA